MTKMYLVRHGESVANTYYAQKLNPPPFEELGPPLTPLGEEQAKILAKKLNKIHFDHVFSSDFIRAKRTAEILVHERNLEVMTTKVIRERHYGKHELDHIAMRRKLHELQQGLSDLEKMQVKLGDDMESEADSASRLLTFLREVAVGYPDKTVLVVAHGTLMRVLLIHLGYAAHGSFPPGSVKNCGYIVLESDGVEFFVKETDGIELRQ